MGYDCKFVSFYYIVIAIVIYLEFRSLAFVKSFLKELNLHVTPVVGLATINTWLGVCKHHLS